MSVANTLGYASFPVPVGTIFFYAGLGVPNTYLDCQGESFDPAEYPLLAGLLGINRTPALEGKIIGGGPLANVNQLEPANSGTITAGSFTLTAANIPTLIDAEVSIVSGSASSLSAWTEIAPVPFTDLGNIPDQAATYPSAIRNITSWSADVGNIVTNNGAAPVNPTLTGGGVTPNTLCLRYIIKAKY
jgi:hypothetical protein